MKTCPACRRENAADDKFCQQCGAALVAAADQTILSGGPSPQVQRQRGQSHRTRTVAELFAGGKDRIIIGRAGDCDIILPHPTVSRRHAALERLADGRLVLHDLESANGIFIDGQRLAEPYPVQERARVGIGPFLFSLDRGLIHSFDSSLGLRLFALHVEKLVVTPKGEKLKLLDDVNLVVEPGEFVTLLGPSGSGKSTLMDCLNGRRRATGGRVLANGEDFYRHFDSFRQSLGYVPQKDIVHTHLTVSRALAYTAKLRLPRDTTAAEVRNRVEDVIREMKLEERRDNPIHTLSGGQLKRVSLGAELIARPALLYIDEATSGLDAGTDAEMMQLFRRLADEEGKSVVCITHNVENVESCHLILVLARGRVVYFGPPDQAPDYFGVKKLSAIYGRLAEEPAEAWHSKFLDSPLHKEYVLKRIQAEPDLQASPAAVADPRAASRATLPPGRSSIVVQAPPPPGRTARPFQPPLWHQFRLLTQRYSDLLFADKRSLQLLLLQAPLVGLLLLVGFLGMSFGDKIPMTRPLTDEEREGLQNFQEQLDYYLGLPKDPARKTWLDRVVAPWLGRPADLPDDARRLVREKLMLAPDAAVTGEVVADLLDRDHRGEASLTPEERETLLRAVPHDPAGHPLDSRQVLAALDAARSVRALEYLTRPLEPPESVRSWIVEQLQLASDATVAGEHAIRLRDKIKKKEIVSIPKDVEDWLKTVPPAPGKEQVVVTMLKRFQDEKVLERLVRAKVAIVPYGEEIPNPRNSYMLLSIIAIIVFWLGCNNAAKEIVKEEAIYSRERAVNLGILPYLGSKFLVLGVLSALQVLLLMVVIYGSLHGVQAVLHSWGLMLDRQFVPPERYCLRYDQQYLVLVLLSWTGVAAGLLLSASVSSPDRASVLLPYMLIPQIILCGSMISVSKGVPYWLAVLFSPVHWAYRAIHRGARDLPSAWSAHEDYNDSVALACLALAIQLGVLLLLTVWCLRRKDVGADRPDWLTRLRNWVFRNRQTGPAASVGKQ